MVTFRVGHAVARMETAEIDFLRHLVSELLKSYPRRSRQCRYRSLPGPSSLDQDRRQEQIIEFAARYGFYRVSAIDGGLSDHSFIKIVHNVDNSKA